MESLTYFKDIKETPKKLRLYLNLIKKMSPQEALDYLLYTPHKQGRIYYKVLHSAIANATNTLKVSPDVLEFKLFTIEEGHVIRRYESGSRGTVKPVKKRFSHIKIILVENTKSKAKGTKKIAAESKPASAKATAGKEESVKEVKAAAKPKTVRALAKGQSASGGKKSEIKKTE